MKINRYTTLQNQNIQFSSKTDGDKKQKNNPAVLAATIAGTLVPMFIIRGYQGKALKSGALKGLDLGAKAKAVLKSFHIEYGLNEMLYTSFGSIAGGLFGGLAFSKNEDKTKKAKIKESIFQFSNIAIPTSIVAGLLELSKKSKSKYETLLKIASVIVGVGAGMPLAAAVSKKVNNTFVDSKNPDTRQLKLKDAFVHVDDLVGAIALAKVPFLDKLPIDQILPVLYAMCGYEAGTKK